MPKRVFVVEDDADIQAFLTMALTAPEFLHEVESIQNGKIVLEKLENGEYPDILLLDLMMPGMNGYTLLEQLYHQGLHTSWLVFASCKN